jgi:iron(III) transport system permease protein
VLITVPVAFGYAYMLTRTCAKGCGAFNAIAAIPLLAPSALPAIALIYLFGNQGLLRPILPEGFDIYGPWGIIMAHVFFAFPQALIILVTALSTADARLYEAAASLGTPARRIFTTITLPGARYGLIGAIFVVFTEVITDFGVAKVIGGQFNVLATDVYKQVVGQQNFPMGATIGLVLLLPAVAAFLVDRAVQRRQQAQLTARAVPLVPQPDARRDGFALGYGLLIAAPILLILGIAAWASFVSYWPYNLSLTLRHYDFNEVDAQGWDAVWNTLRLGVWSACIGTPLVFITAYLLDRVKDATRLVTLGRILVLIPLSVPGLVMGLAYIFFFNAPWNPLNLLYGTLAILILNTVMRLVPVTYVTATTALTAIDREFDVVPASRTFYRVTVPLCLPTLLGIWIYFFTNAATTLSAIIFLYVAGTKTASIAIVNMDEAGATASAAAMGMIIVGLCAAAKLVQLTLVGWIERRRKRWTER